MAAPAGQGAPVLPLTRIWIMQQSSQHTTSFRPSLSFRQIAPGLAAGTELSHPWQPLASVPLLILVGVTGAGKSTLLEGLGDGGLDYRLLPDRRILTDELIIATMQWLDGETPQPVRDRVQRFNYTRRYREHFPGGMAYSLTQLWVDPTQGGEVAATWLFDGLRGENEVTVAAQSLPLARFIMLDAPDWIRVQRLLGRADEFDQVSVTAASPDALTFEALGFPEATALFTPAETSRIFSWVTHGQVRIDELQAKLKIVVEERRSYDPVATKQALLRIAPERTLWLDTSTASAREIASKALAWIDR
jgi:hypothetical protein